MKITNFLIRNKVSFYFLIAFFISWICAFIPVANKLIEGIPLSKTDGLLMYPLMLIGPPISGLLICAIVEGRAGLRLLFQKITFRGFSPKWYCFILIPPSVIFIVLFILNHLYAGQFIPHYFFIGFLFGVPAGFLEEIGWTGFAFPNMLRKYGFNISVFLLGLIWGLWHFPVIDFLGAAFPHGIWLWPFIGAFILAMVAIRIFICYLYTKTGSILMAQLFHIFSTGSLVVFGPQVITAGKECLWYFVYAIILWVLIFVFRKGIFTPAAVTDI